jgi:hypothetical protein
MAAHTSGARCQKPWGGAWWLICWECWVTGAGTLFTKTILMQATEGKRLGERCLQPFVPLRQPGSSHRPQVDRVAYVGEALRQIFRFAHRADACRPRPLEPNVEGPGPYASQIAAPYLIPTRVRRGALRIVGNWQAKPEALIRDLETRVGFRTVGDFVEALDERIGPGAGSEFYRRLVAEVTGPTSSMQAEYGLTTSSVPHATELASLKEAALLAMPDQLFTAALDAGFDIASAYAFELFRSEEAQRDIHDGIAQLFVGNGIPYAFDETGRLTPTGSATMTAATVQPALDVLGDPRLANARTHLVEAQQRLQEHDPDEAVDEARMAVEYGMLALLDATGTPRPAKHQPQDLFDALAAPGQGPPVLSRAAEELVLSAPRFRGRTTAGHAGSPAVVQGEAEAVVGAAAASLVFLGSKLPS